MNILLVLLGRMRTEGRSVFLYVFLRQVGRFPLLFACLFSACLTRNPISLTLETIKRIPLTPLSHFLKSNTHLTESQKGSSKQIYAYSNEITTSLFPNLNLTYLSLYVINFPFLPLIFILLVICFFS